MYIIDLRNDDEFSSIEGIVSLAEKMIKTKKNLFSLIYIYIYIYIYISVCVCARALIKLSLLLPIATTIVKRVFSIMHIVKSKLQNRMRNKWMNDSLVVYIEKDIFDQIDNEVIMKWFQNIKTRRE